MIKSTLLAILCSLVSCLSEPNQELSNKNELVFHSAPINVESIGMKAGTTYSVSDTIDLRGGKLFVPKDVTINVKKGVIKNGVIVGQNTKIQYKNKVFDRVHIEGTWIVPCIKTSMFCDLSYSNSLRDVMALTNTSIHNCVQIEDGNYNISLNRDADCGLWIKDNTTVQLDGCIILEPNSYPNYSIVKIDGESITVKGTGKIIGDRNDHMGTKGEWGMGITLSAQNVNISGISILNCWGDCIYITGGSKDVSINNCIIDGGRRQGISVISGDDILISKCSISNIGGVDPGYAIDIEPNAGNSVGTVVINRVFSENCEGGLTANGRANNSRVNKIIVRNSIFKALGKPAVISSTCNDITIKNCQIIQEKGNKTIAFDHINNLSVTRNSFSYQNSMKSQITKRVKAVLKVESWPIIVSECENTKIENNKGL